MNDKRRPGYIAIARTIFEHPLFKDNSPLSRLEAWQWLISQAAWKPVGKRRKHGVVHLERGQLAFTVRELAASWRWPKSNVARFLEKLATQEMISADRIACGTKNGPGSEIKSSYPMKVLTICNYDEFQLQSNRKNSRAGQNAGQNAGQESLELPEIVAELAPLPYNHTTIDSREGSGDRRNRRNRPKHGAKWQNRVFFHFESPEWRIYATDYWETRHMQIFPESYIDGRGNWFIYLGEKSNKRRA